MPLDCWVLYRTRFGLRLRAVGENPAAVDTAGISVAWLRYRAVIITGVLCGIAGAYLSIAQYRRLHARHDRGQGLHRAGRADLRQVAALAGAVRLPAVRLPRCAVGIRLQGVVLPAIGQVPVQFIQALPYILTVILLAGFVGKAIPPEGRRHALCQGALSEHRRHAARPPRPRAPTPMRPIRAFRSAPPRGTSGRLYAGCNVENAAYPEGQCAETSAIGVMVAAGEKAIAAILVVADGPEPVSALRRLPPAPARIRRTGDAGVSL